MSVQTLTILGATGSIGGSTLDVVRRHPDRYRVFALTAFQRMAELADLCREFRPDCAVAATAEQAAALAGALRADGIATEVLWGEQGLIQVAAHEQVDAVMAAIVGAAGLESALAAARAGKRVLLANKEALVMAGPVFMAAVRENGAVLLPIDSEHNAIFQSLPRGFSRNLDDDGVRRILLTASGGPFRTTPAEAMAAVTPAQAVAHPKWSMGPKISVDSATLMNKGLEVIEASFLFNLPAERIDVVVHPQSIIHSLVEYVDGSVLAQLGNPDMRTPIAHALAYPERIDSGVAPLDLFQVARLDFEAPDLERFPCLGLAYRALREGGRSPAVLNAANEVAVAAFLDGRIGFAAIPRLIAAVLDEVGTSAVHSLGDVREADRLARQAALGRVAGH
ncbi:1-deoxy-D-xylulose-5-phosphate reductoisomerase [Oryzomicrobium sp.]|uniref:1-deoxy-D-xylulose-5-phosphate reductoisomerase n=1 Tax=Oryzomicrobium sp. TaxID=1911578 RepID=UPI002FDFE061